MSIGRCDPAIAQSVFPVVSRRSTRETKKGRCPERPRDPRDSSRPLLPQLIAPRISGNVRAVFASML